MEKNTINYGITGTRAYGPISEDSDLDLVITLPDSITLLEYLAEHDIPITQLPDAEKYNNGETSCFYFSLGGILINVIVPKNKEEYMNWKRRTEAMKKLPPIPDKELRVARFNAL